MNPFDKTQTSYHFPVVIFSTLFFGFFCYNQYTKIIPFPDFKHHQALLQESSNSAGVERQETKKDEAGGENERTVSPLESCDIFTGEWVFDNGSSHPLYREQDCQFLNSMVTCLKNGRPDSSYHKWRWQPRDCSLLKFEAKLLLEKLRGKRLMFVGDSISFNQMLSMVCVVQSVIPSEKKSFTYGNYANVFKMMDYNATIEFYWAPFLVESNVDPPNMRDGTVEPIVKLESISKHGDNWKNVDYLIFNTFIWWRYPTVKVLRGGSFDDAATDYVEIDQNEAYEAALKLWAKWVEENVYPNRTSVFFTSMAPMHMKSSAWNNTNGINCSNETTPILNTSAFDVGTNWQLFAATENVVQSVKIPVHFLNITGLSEYRKDAHTSIYGAPGGKLLTQEQKSDPARYADCVHWCLPGLPDTWNELLFTLIMYRT